MSRLYTASERHDWVFRSFRSYVLGYLAYRNLPPLRRELLGGEAGTHWSDWYYARGEDYYRERFREPLRLCSDALRQNSRCRFMQIGCAGGRELSILAGQFPDACFRGIDVSQGGIQRNAERYASIRNLDFQVADIAVPESWNHWKPQVIYSSGCLEYLTEGEVLAFFEASRQSGVKQLILYEPWDIEVRQVSVPRGGAAFVHDYPVLLCQAGWANIQTSLDSHSDGSLLLVRAWRE